MPSLDFPLVFSLVDGFRSCGRRLTVNPCEKFHAVTTLASAFRTCERIGGATTPLPALRNRLGSRCWRWGELVLERRHLPTCDVLFQGGFRHVEAKSKLACCHGCCGPDFRRDGRAVGGCRRPTRRFGIAEIRRRHTSPCPGRPTSRGRGGYGFGKATAAAAGGEVVAFTPRLESGRIVVPLTIQNTGDKRMTYAVTATVVGGQRTSPSL